MTVYRINVKLNLIYEKFMVFLLIILVIYRDYGGIYVSYNPFNHNSIVSSNLFARLEEYILKVIRKLDRLRWVCHQVFFCMVKEEPERPL